MANKIVVTTPINPASLDQLKEVGKVVVNPQSSPWSLEELQQHCLDADALMVFMTDTINAGFLDKCPKLKIVAGALKGYNNIDVKACNERNIILTIVPDLLTEPTAELAIGLIISVTRNFVPGDQHIRKGDFKGWRPLFYGNSINGSTIGVIGAGAVGKAIMRMLNGFDCKKLYHDKTQMSAEEELRLKATYASVEKIQNESDILILGIHLDDKTKHMIDANFLTKMKRGSYLINPARGSLVDESAVVKALQEDHLAGYATDTFEMEDWTIAERPRQIHPYLLSSDKTVLTPHIGSAVISVRQAIEQSATDSICSVLGGQIPKTSVNSSDIMLQGQ